MWSSGDRVEVNASQTTFDFRVRLARRRTSSSRGNPHPTVLESDFDVYHLYVFFADCTHLPARVPDAGPCRETRSTALARGRPSAGQPIESRDYVMSAFERCFAFDPFSSSRFASRPHRLVGQL